MLVLLLFCEPSQPAGRSAGGTSLMFSGAICLGALILGRDDVFFLRREMPKPPFSSDMAQVVFFLLGHGMLRYDTTASPSLLVSWRQGRAGTTRTAGARRGGAWALGPSGVRGLGASGGQKV